MPKGVQKLANDRQIPFLFNTAEEASFDAPGSKAYCEPVCKRTLTCFDQSRRRILQGSVARREQARGCSESPVQQLIVMYTAACDLTAAYS